MALQPVGPLPSSTYWRRRLVLLVVVLIALFLLAKACSGGKSANTLAAGHGSPAASPVASPVASPAAPAAAPPASSVASVAPSPSPAGSPSPAPLQTCRDSVMQVTVQSDAEAYPSGAEPKFTLTVRNTGTVACRRALGPGAVELRVFSGADRIWSSGDCDQAKDQGVITLPAGQARATTVQWSGKRTKPGCVTGSTAQPGTYRVSARVGDIVQQGSVFRVT